MILKKHLQHMFVNAVNLNHKNIESLLEKNKKALFVDLGCADGLLSMRFGKFIGTKNIAGVDINASDIKKAKLRGVRAIQSDLNESFLFPSSSFDVVYSNQVSEHIANSDKFLFEIRRILKPGGYAIVSTENASSWCNIGSSLMGWQIFSLTNFSGVKRSIGNPFAIHRSDENESASWQHMRIYNVLGLKEYLEVIGFAVEKIMGSGYFPLPAVLGKLDVIHSHFITFKVRKTHE